MPPFYLDLNGRRGHIPLTVMEALNENPVPSQYRKVRSEHMRPGIGGFQFTGIPVSYYLQGMLDGARDAFFANSQFGLKIFQYDCDKDRFFHVLSSLGTPVYLEQTLALTEKTRLAVSRDPSAGKTLQKTGRLLRSAFQDLDVVQKVVNTLQAKGPLHESLAGTLSRYKEGVLTQVASGNVNCEEMFQLARRLRDDAHIMLVSQEGASGRRLKSLRATAKVAMVATQTLQACLLLTFVAVQSLVPTDVIVTWLTSVVPSSTLMTVQALTQQISLAAWRFLLQSHDVAFGAWSTLSLVFTAAGGVVRLAGQQLVLFLTMLTDIFDDDTSSLRKLSNVALQLVQVGAVTGLLQTVNLTTGSVKGTLKLGWTVASDYIYPSARSFLTYVITQALDRAVQATRILNRSHAGIPSLFSADRRSDSNKLVALATDEFQTVFDSIDDISDAQVAVLFTKYKQTQLPERINALDAAFALRQSRVNRSTFGGAPPALPLALAPAVKPTALPVGQVPGPLVLGSNVQKNLASGNINIRVGLPPKEVPEQNVQAAGSRKRKLGPAPVRRSSRKR